MFALKVIAFLVALKSFIFRLYFAVGDIKERVVNAALQAEAQVLARLEEDRVTVNTQAVDRYEEFEETYANEVDLAHARRKDSYKAVKAHLIATGEKLSKRGQAAQARINAIRQQG